jgi:hypothetical protein
MESDVSTPGKIGQFSLPPNGNAQELAAATSQAGVFALDAALSIVEAPTDELTAARRLRYVADRCGDLTRQLAEQSDAD